MAVKDKIRNLLAEKLKCDMDRVVPHAELVNDLGADSISMMELVTILEDKFDLDIGEENAGKFFRVQDINNYIEGYC